MHTNTQRSYSACWVVELKRAGCEDAIVLPSENTLGGARARRHAHTQTTARAFSVVSLVLFFFFSSRETSTCIVLRHTRRHVRVGNVLITTRAAYGDRAAHHLIYRFIYLHTDA